MKALRYSLGAFSFEALLPVGGGAFFMPGENHAKKTETTMLLPGMPEAY